ncbi:MULTISPECIES: MarR family winged helix-turn-helix transcriptional regulator [Fusobacterium]|uniref:MarR family winged helix-turn-helix transcriptional regulator n=1 Tax=Fusobacterium TaxID=848 RepID=UPI0014775B8C|nr:MULTISPECIES: MarR family transcriptional regulator [Fusobacterium]NME36235.1 MarR family transcriptional regulator [Fusobacterium sp. FSA-380-WT-3A]
MKKEIFSNKISNIRYCCNFLINQELTNYGFPELQSSYGAIIYTLFNYHPLTMKELAEKVQRDPSTLTVLVKKLIEKGYIEKIDNEKDSRSKLIILTEKSYKAKKVFDKISEKLNSVIWKDFSEEEIKTLCNGLEKIHKNLKSFNQSEINRR